MRVVTMLSLLLLSGQALAADFFTGMDNHIGCFYDQPQDRDLPVAAPLPSSLSQSLTIKACTAACAGLYYRYAGLQGGDSCYCGGSFGRHGPGQCTIRCEGNTTQTCGGPSSNTVYGTGYSRPGPPADLTQLSKSPTGMYLNWSLPTSTNGQLTEFQVSLSLASSHHPAAGRSSPLLLRFSASALSARVGDLLPGSQYKVGVSAVSAEGEGPPLTRLLWTEVGPPAVPPHPKLLPSPQPTPGRLRVRLEGVEECGGPVTAYQVVVLDASLHRSFEPSSLLNYNSAVEAGHPYWVAAKLTPKQLGDFLVGDGRQWGGFWNHELPHDKGQRWKVELVVVSTLNGQTKSSYSGSREQEGVAVLEKEAEQEETNSSPLVIGLSVAIVIGLLVLVAAIGVFVYLRQSLGTKWRRRRADTQELTPQPPATQSEEGGFLGDGSYTNEVMRTAEEYLESLKGKVWLIPKNFLEVSGEVLGEGKFGSVVRATVSSQGRPVSCNTQVIPRLEEEHLRKAMLRDLDSTIRVGQHPALACLLGICEEPTATLVAMEQGETRLKQWLLGSRALTHHPQYAAQHSRTATAREEVVLELAAGLASGLAHLEQVGVSHGAVCARNVLMAGETGAKLAGFGMSSWARRGERLDCSRWMASEALMNSQSGPKCDVWSFGCLLWEMVTLGGTPYSALRTREVGPRVARGLRLHRVSGLSDQLYQLMLACWMTDPDERPTAEELQLMLADLARGGGPELDFSLTGEFQYEPCVPELEIEAMGLHVPHSTAI